MKWTWMNQTFLKHTGEKTLRYCYTSRVGTIRMAYSGALLVLVVTTGYWKAEICAVCDHIPIFVKRISQLERFFFPIEEL